MPPELQRHEEAGIEDKRALTDFRRRTRLCRLRRIVDGCRRAFEESFRTGIWKAFAYTHAAYYYWDITYCYHYYPVDTGCIRLKAGREYQEESSGDIRCLCLGQKPDLFHLHDSVYRRALYCRQRIVHDTSSFLLMAADSACRLDRRTMAARQVR